MLTCAQHKLLHRADKNGIIQYYGPRGFGRSSWQRAVEAMAALGLVYRLDSRVLIKYSLTSKGERYLNGSQAANVVWKNFPELRPKAWGSAVLSAISDMLGPNVLHPDVVKAGAKQQWLDLRSKRTIVWPLS